MANAVANRSEIQQQIAYAISALDSALNYAISNSPNWLTLEQTFLQNLKNDYVPEASGQIAQLRASLDSIVRQAATVLAPLIREYGDIIDATETDPRAILDRIYDDMIIQGTYISSRQITHDVAPTALRLDGNANNGNGTVRRLIVDENGYELEAMFPSETTTIECLNDKYSRAVEGEEVWEFRGQNRGRDALRLSGSGFNERISGRSMRDSLVKNPSFTQLAGTAAAPTAITGWTPNITVDSTNFVFDESTYYIGVPGETTHRSLRVKDNCIVSQQLNALRQPLDARFPYYEAIAYNAEDDLATGTLKLGLGSISTTVVVDGKSGWNLLFLPIGSNNYYKNFQSTTATTAYFQVTSLANTLLVDHFRLEPYVFYGGTFWLVEQGSTPFLRGDAFQATDSAIEAIIQKWIWRAFGKYLPHATGSTVNWTGDLG